MVVQRTFIKEHSFANRLYVLVGNYHQKRTNFTTYARIRNTFQQSSHLQIEPKLQQIGIGSLKVLFML